MSEELLNATLVQMDQFKKQRDAALAEVERLKGEIDTWITSDKRFAELQDLRAQLASALRREQDQITLRKVNLEQLAAMTTERDALKRTVNWHAMPDGQNETSMETELESMRQQLTASERERAVLREALEKIIEYCGSEALRETMLLWIKDAASAALVQTTPPQECQPVEGQGERVTDLLPCPFCGKPPKLTKYPMEGAHPDHDIVRCETSGCPATHSGAAPRDRWNTRTKPTPPPEPAASQPDPKTTGTVGKEAMQLAPDLQGCKHGIQLRFRCSDCEDERASQPVGKPIPGHGNDLGTGEVV